MGKAQKKRKTGECVYCGKHGPVTDDHIPPKNLFPKPRPHNLVTVPSCYPCNEGASKDDEYFRLCLAILENAKGHPARDSILPSVLRSLSRRKATGLSEAFWSSTVYAERISPAGLYLGTGILLSISLERLDRVAIRIIKGLLFHETRRRLPDDYVVRPLHISRIPELDSEVRQAVEDFIYAMMEKEPERIGDVFAFSRLWSPAGWPRSVWLLGFYGEGEYYCQIGPREVEAIML
jgi:hypothetical protein